MIEQTKNKLRQASIEFKENTPLAPYTTWKIGGPAEIFIEAKDLETIATVAQICHTTKTKLTLLGWGSNVLISDKGIQGVVIKNNFSEIKVIGDYSESTSDIKKISPRLVQASPEKYYSISDIEYSETSAEKVIVEIASGTPLPLAINKLISLGITGLQWFSGIPGTIGGAIFNNIHGGNHFISEYVKSVKVLNEGNEILVLSKSELDFDYDYSRFHNSKEIILSAEMILYKGDKEKALSTSMEWARKKKLQPANSAGCCFQNISAETQTKLNLVSNSWGYIIDEVLKLKGYAVGKAKISEKHAAFIETEKGASANDVLAIFRKIYSEAYQKIGITPKPEIFFLGFEDVEIKEFI